MVELQMRIGHDRKILSVNSLLEQPEKVAVSLTPGFSPVSTGATRSEPLQRL
jgi:hypothetical protein